MTTRIYNKLIRDKIPDIIEANGQQATVRILSESEGFSELKNKLSEETNEFKESDELEELADILEVIYALAVQLKSSPAELERIREAKKQERGGFEKGLFLETVTANPQNQQGTYEPQK